MRPIPINRNTSYSDSSANRQRPECDARAHLRRQLGFDHHQLHGQQCPVLIGARIWRSPVRILVRPSVGHFGASIHTACPTRCLGRREPNEHRFNSPTFCHGSHGTHTFKIGADINFIHEVMINLFQGGGIYTYHLPAERRRAFNNWVADVAGINLGDGLTGRHWTTFTQVTDPITHVGKDDFWMKEPAFFVEDTVESAFESDPVTLGLRYDIQLVPQPPQPYTATPLTTLYTSNDQHRLEQLRAAFRRGLADRQRHGAAFGLRHVLRQDARQHLLRAARGKWRVPANLRLHQPCSLPGADVSQRDLHAARPAHAAPFPGALTPTGDARSLPPPDRIWCTVCPRIS